MKFLVCVKQVPVLARLEFDEKTRTVRRDGVPSEVSAFDIRAVLRAISLRDEMAGEVVVLTMGPPQAAEALDYCLALGADRAIHLCDRAFAGADTLATARALALAIRRENPELILLGRHSIDAETSQVGPELAELLGVPQVTAARTLRIASDRNSIEAEREIDDGFETVRAAIPTVVTVAEDIAPERFPRKADREAARDKPRSLVTAADLSDDPTLFGTAGSPTWVSDLRPITCDRLGRILDSESPANSATELARILVESHGLFTRWDLPAIPPATPEIGRVERSRAQDFWAIVEYTGDALRPVSLEIVAKLRVLADRFGGRVSAVVLSGSASESFAKLAAAGADRILLAQLEPDRTSIGQITAQLASAIAALHPGALVFPATTFGRDIAPRLAARLGLGLTSDCVDLGLDADGRLEQFKSAFGSSFIAPILSRTQPEMATVRPGVLPAANLDRARTVVVEMLPPAAPFVGADTQRITHRHIGDDAAALDHAEIAIGIGMGVGGNEGIERLQPLIDVLGASLCATRDVTDAGWMPRQFQVGLTGRSIGPKLYIGLGIRGAFEHMVGLRRSGLIVVVNKNAKALAFKNADYGIVASIDDVVPPLVSALTALRLSCGHQPLRADTAG